MEYSTIQQQEKTLDIGNLLCRLDQAGLTGTDAYQEIIEMHRANMQREYKPQLRKGFDFFENGFAGIERSVKKAEEFARLNSSYYERLRGEQHQGYRVMISVRNAMMGYLGREAKPLPTLQQLLDQSLDFVEEINGELTPAREASLVLASTMADYKNNRVVVKLNHAGQYLEKVSGELGQYEDLLREVNQALSKMRINSEENCVLMLAQDNIRRYLTYWRGEETKAKQDIVFKGPEVDIIASYEELCWASVQFCDRFKNNIDNLADHLNKTKPVLEQISATSSQLGALEQVVYPLTRLALQNVVIIGEATDKMARIATRPELDGGFPSELSPILRTFVAKMTGQKRKRDASLDQMAARILNTEGYFSRR